MESMCITKLEKIIVTKNTTLKELLETINGVESAAKTPTPKYLRENAGEPIVEMKIDNCKCIVYANGYAVYSNGSGTTVVWLPDCCSFTYQFNELKNKEKDCLSQKSIIDENVLGNQPWFIAVILKGEHQIEKNNMNRQFDRKGRKKELRDNNEKQRIYWASGYYFESPEDAFIRKETLEEQLETLTDKQRDVFILYHKYGYKQREIAQMLKITQQAVNFRLTNAEKKIRLTSI